MVGTLTNWFQAVEVEDYDGPPLAVTVEEHDDKRLTIKMSYLASGEYLELFNMEIPIRMEHGNAIIQ